MERAGSSAFKGERAVLAFIAACLGKDLAVARPVYGSDVGYDVIVHNLATDRMWRVQVKMASVHKRLGDYWYGSLRKRRRSHSPRYRLGLMDAYVFAKPRADDLGFDGFWIVLPEEIEKGKGGGRKLRRAMWERWSVFEV